MTLNGFLQIGLFFGVLLALVKPLGWYMAQVYEGQPPVLERLLGALERLGYRLCGVRPEAEMSWQTYTTAMLVFNLVGILAVYGLQRLQGLLPLNPQGFGSVAPDLAFNTAVSFASNTNWQAYGGETTLSYLTQMLGLTVQNFVSAASGMATLMALIRGIRRHATPTIGNFWVDLTRGTLYILLPLALVLALILVGQGVLQNFQAYRSVPLLQPAGAHQSQAQGMPPQDGQGELRQQDVRRVQMLPMGPVASQVAIKQLGTNGGGFFSVNAAHPFENPTPFSGFCAMLAILLLPVALCYTFGVMVGDTRQGWTLLAAMSVIFVVLLALCVWAEQSGNPRLAALGLDTTASERQAGGNMEGKEVRFGIINSALWTTATSAASNGSVNAMHDSYTPLGGLVPLFLIQLGEVIYGGVGSGLYGMLVFALLTVFVAGLMVGRTPEYLGKKIEAYEVKMAALVILIPALVVLVFTALAVVLPAGTGAISNPGAHGLTQVLYAYSSQGNNNGSAFAGLGVNTPFYNFTGGLAMLIGRYGLAIPVLALAGSLARKSLVPAGPGTLPTSTPLFVVMLMGMVLIVGALTFIPALALGPIVEHLLLSGL